METPIENGFSYIYQVLTNQCLKRYFLYLMTQSQMAMVSLIQNLKPLSVRLYVIGRAVIDVHCETKIYF